MIIREGEKSTFAPIRQYLLRKNVAVNYDTTEAFNMRIQLFTRGTELNKTKSKKEFDSIVSWFSRRHLFLKQYTLKTKFLGRMCRRFRIYQRRLSPSYVPSQSLYVVLKTNPQLSRTVALYRIFKPSVNRKKIHLFSL